MGNESVPKGVFLARPEEPAAGISLAVKDLFDTAGLVTTYGSKIFAERVPGRTAEAVRRLEAAGYANVGKTNLHEFAYGITSQNPHFGTVPNPIGPGRIAGGSSGGSAAALAGGFAEAALGTDTAGSIRIPAACCGVVGFKPTYGLVPMDGCFPLAPGLDHGGPMARTVEACTEMMKALAPGFEPRRLESLKDVSVGVTWIEQADPLVADRVGAAASLFPRRRSLDLPLPTGTRITFMREVANVHRDLFGKHRADYGENVRVKVERCLAVTDDEYEDGLRALDEYRVRWAELVEDIDLVLTPTIPCVAPPLDADDLEIRDRMTLLTYPFNCVGAPALALPCGQAEDGLPASVQLVGRPGEDALVLAAGATLYAALAAAS